MRKRYLVILTGIILSFAVLTGCGGGGQVNGTPGGNSSQREDELQAEIDTLRQELDALKEEQGQQDAGAGGGNAAPDEGEDANTADDSVAENSTAGTDSAAQNTQGGTGNAAGGANSGNTGNQSASAVAVSLESARDIALARVPGATAKNVSIELDRDDGWYVYEGEIYYNGMEYEFEIDADTGNILKWEEERW